jgi:RhtB (resistance to homoserine/threonine) family protein
MTIYGIENYLGFIIAGILLNLTPGADTMYILTRSITQGRRAGIYSVLGISTGALIHTTFVAFGLSIVLAKSAFAFNMIKYVGVAYLVYLGIKMIVEKNNLFDNKNQKIETTDLFKIYRQGLLTNVLNPKMVLFFLSLLPQFINPLYVNGSIPFLILGVTFLITGTIWCLILAYSASLISQTLRNNDKIGKIMQKISGSIFIGLGIKILTDK